MMTDATQVAQAGPPPPSAPAPRRSFVNSVAWVAGSKWGGQALTSGITILVARILTPSDYGLLGMGIVFLGFVRFLSEFGIGGSVIVMRESDRSRLAALNVCALLLGVAGMAITLICAKPLAHFFHAPQLSLLLVVTSVGFVVGAFRTIPAAVLQRDFRFKLLAGIDLSQAVLAALITLALALAGAGYWALVFGNLIAATLGTVGVVWAAPQPFARPRVAELRPAAALSRNITTSTLSWYIYSNADFLIVGKMLGEASLGLYNIGWTMAMLIVERVTTLVGGVAPSYLAAAKDDVNELRRYLCRISGTISLATFPASLGLALVAGDFCRVILGPRWLGAIGPLRLLAIYASARSLGPLLAQILTVSGEDGFVAINGVAAAVVMPVAFFVGSRWGVNGVALAWVFAYPIVTVPMFVKTLRTLRLPVSEYFDAIRPALVSSVVMVACVLAFQAAATHLYPALRLAGSVIVGAGAYSAVIYFGFRSRVEQLIRTLRPKRGAAPAPA